MAFEVKPDTGSLFKNSSKSKDGHCLATLGEGGIEFTDTVLAHLRDTKRLH